MRGRSWPKAPGAIALFLALWVPGCGPHSTRGNCREAGGTVVEDGTRCTVDLQCFQYANDGQCSLLMPQERCWDEWHCVLPAEAPK